MLIFFINPDNDCKLICTDDDPRVAGFRKACCMRAVDDGRSIALRVAGDFVYHSLDKYIDGRNGNAISEQLPEDLAHRFAALKAV